MEIFEPVTNECICSVFCILIFVYSQFSQQYRNDQYREKVKETGMLFSSSVHFTQSTL